MGLNLLAIAPTLEGINVAKKMVAISVPCLQEPTVLNSEDRV